MKLFIIFIVFCAIAYYYRFFKMREEVKSDPLKTLLDKKIITQVGLFSVTMSYFVTDTLLGFIIVTSTLFILIVTLGMSYSDYSSPRFNIVLIGIFTLCIPLLLLLERHILIRSNGILLMIFPYVMILYGSFFGLGSKNKPLYLFIPLILGVILILSAIRYFPEIWVSPQERVSDEFIHNTLHGEIISLHYNTGLRGEPLKITTTYSTGANDDNKHVVLIYKDAQIISCEAQHD
ncbi:hypothetical protein [Fusibacter ferrireducens]|uniref:Uncharacterized protein n=1 Tax=Fusibacter ferrireducens TaxID=2785058 RepID=A0ABR9ZN76_9FIRM|nr:hypothetical protein [Fusibacter ferrireducens]MBF4691928.1 hypothetical protein [Fusibacter ferrireducens]